MDIFANGRSGVFWEELKEREILKALEEHGWHRKAAAARLGISVSAICANIKRMRAKGIVVKKSHDLLKEFSDQAQQSDRS